LAGEALENFLDKILGFRPAPDAALEELRQRGTQTHGKLGKAMLIRDRSAENGFRIARLYGAHGIISPRGLPVEASNLTLIRLTSNQRQPLRRGLYY
jgi:hypothetical protein